MVLVARVDATTWAVTAASSTASTASTASTLPPKTVTRSRAEVEALFAVLLAKHPLFCFGLVAPVKPDAAAVDAAIDLRQTSLFLASVEQKLPLMADTEHVRPFFESVFKYIPDPVTSPPLQSRRSTSANALSFVFSKKPDDVDVFFNQVKDHINAVHKSVRNIVKDVDVMAGMQIDYANALHDLDTKLSEISMQEQLDSIAGQYRKLTKVINALEQNINSQSRFLITHYRPILYAYRRSMECMRISLDARLVALDEYEDACKLVVKKAQVVERLAATAGSAGPVYQTRAETAMFELRKAKDDEQTSKDRFISATDTIRESYGTVRNAQADELQQLLNSYVAHQLQTNTEILDAINLWV